MSRVASTDYNKYTNQQLSYMISELLSSNIINYTLANKFTDAIFKRHHDKLNSDDERKQAQRINALQYYYRKKLIKMYEASDILWYNKRISNAEDFVKKLDKNILHQDDPDILLILHNQKRIVNREIQQLKKERVKCNH